MLGGGQLRSGTTGGTKRVDEPVLLEGTATRIALVAPCALCCAKRASTLYVSIRKEHLAGTTPELIGDLFLDVTSFLDLQEKILSQFIVPIAGRRTAVMVELDSQ